MGKRKAETAQTEPATDYGECQLKSQCVAFFTRTRDGFYKKASAEDKSTSKDAMETYQQMDADQKLDFARKFLSQKGKGIGWVKTYMEEMTSRTRTTNTMKEGYCTRTGNARAHAS